ncbi:serine-glycine hydroxymethyltransferase [Encephalitozoon intestinalis ATCC 50506]|uniref:Serine hydroxymethyltransferase n=1 Tax=Encephalitozoon intestinalis (strain ATCC 50506) TaxID=876142 RepID=E0S585_ENCIT|nr:serine hydroxymethyltransferase [Encephalitozoon intestinalis ATCC 50506]XP_003072358.1 serine-glycine hydroxymethyltransferase [Encephalitozoon intestinalis ATCC 50506]UTX44502.1 serine-glycine hydroxymethyltransferase [Encephalitozoon intestinalis]ADM10870.1 serine hydroxymethyltransferase [Encephalitozoon intestinalis ATCC 50506]ADM10998.1 serine-glycine hydroxymethyltransferase [Encephalitozoon intestinalis ATCC 50506]UTX44636.1 serine-glycine hydroxymethyltransferase [Encephalitozoon i
MTKGRGEGFWTGPMETVDPELHALICGEAARQQKTINLIASENYVHQSVMEACGSVLTNKYSEGRVGERYYGGTQWIDKIETLCQKRALSLFGLDPAVWGVNVQPYSGSPANFAVYTALVPPGGRIMGLDLPSGGHLTHGYRTKTRKISATSVYFDSRAYRIGPDGFIDYNALEDAFNNFQPHILICGYSAYSRDIDYKRLSSLAASNNAFLFADISHISPLVACGLMNSPFNHCDVVMTTTQKGLRGPRGALIFYRKTVTKNAVSIDLDTKINFAVFPMLQGGPHNHTIAGIASALLHAATPEFAEYARCVVENSKALSAHLLSLGFDIPTGGTDNHMFLVDLKNKDVNATAVEHVCDILGISLNRNTIAGDSSPLNPSGIRIGTYAVTARGLGPHDMRELAAIINGVVELCRETFPGKSIPKAELQKTASALLSSSPAAADLKKRVLALVDAHPIYK